MEVDMRKLIAGMRISVDGKIEGPAGYADWVEAWSEDYGLTPQIDACVVGGGMYPHYEHYWTAIQNEPDKPHPMSNRLPTKGARRRDDDLWSISGDHPRGGRYRTADGKERNLDRPGRRNRRWLHPSLNAD